MSELKPMFDNFVSALGDRFRQQYPQGSIISDLVQIHGDQYVVKVSVSLANNILVSTLAADANLMLAENRAMERALTILGIRDLQQSAHEPVNLTVKPLPDLPIGLSNAVEQPQVALAESLPNFDTESSLPEPDAEISTTNGKVATDSAPPEISATLPEPPIETVPQPEVPVAKSSRTKKATATPDPLPAMAANNTLLPEVSLDETTVPITYGASEAIAEPPLSVTDMIPMINMELKRLGWSKERGREYMVSLYNKRASALLSDEELLGLLQHLQAEPIV